MLQVLFPLVGLSARTVKTAPNVLNLDLRFSWERRTWVRTNSVRPIADSKYLPLSCKNAAIYDIQLTIHTLFNEDKTEISFMKLLKFIVK
jgi:hypothetical protein